MLPFKSLNAETSVGSGVQKDLEGTFFNHAVFLTHSTNPTSFEVDVQVSPDGSLWVSIGSVTTAGGHASFSFPARYVKARVVSIAGPSADVTAWVASC